MIGSLVSAPLKSLHRVTQRLEGHLIYLPDRRIVVTPRALGVDWEDVIFPAADGTELHGWFVPGDSAFTFLWFHGNAGNLSGRIWQLAAFHFQLGAALFAIDYRGYGRSRGTPTEDGLYLDAEGALAELRRRSDVDQDRIVYFGQSLGGAVAVDLATRHRPAGIVLEAAFTSAADMARILYPYVPAWPFLRSRFDSVGKMRHMHAPLLMFHGARDGIVPLEIGRRLLDAAPGSKKLVVFDDADHDDCFVCDTQTYFSSLRSFLEGLE